MKNYVFVVMALFAVSFTSCLKSYKCDCPPGTTLSVSTTDEVQAFNMCQEKSGGRCTL